MVDVNKACDELMKTARLIDLLNYRKADLDMAIEGFVANGFKVKEDTRDEYRGAKSIAFLGKYVGVELLEKDNVLALNTFWNLQWRELWNERFLDTP